ncbi:N-acetylmuramoyl-L-alanine amidase [Prochlorococcus marinus]|uniref:N-acetylmuramoyl-L-alanine amidase n=1 Tax=Prochlorococcus marinus TaxID=1219 RepID=UPI0022B3FE24|nr:N-acetylmuramoyl-L-alanine amidase [Prochlorococcus marinus]
MHLFSIAEPLDIFLGPRFHKKTIWKGNRTVSSSIPILVMAGHADSQGIEGSGTPGEAVGVNGLPPMDNSVSDELFWNLKVMKAVVRLGKKKGLNISSYDSRVRTIVDENDFNTNWSVGSKFAAKGGYVLEIHFDSYGAYGLGSGLIPPLSKKLNNIDESLARTFGRYPLFFRGGLGAPRRNIRILEIGKLEGELEKNLRNIDSRDQTIEKIAEYIVNAFLEGINSRNSFNPQLKEDYIFLQDSYQ